MPSADVEVYGALARALAPLGVRWYVFGAQAAIAVLAAQEQFDEQRTRGLIELLEQALDQSDLMPAFERCLRRAKRVRGRPR
jgi:hypothetical protein